MKIITRRAFIISGMVSVYGFFLWKNSAVMTDDIRAFLLNYESVIPLEDVLNIGNHASPFEEKLLSMLASLGMVKTKIVLDKTIKDEYQSGKVKNMNGWVVSKTEFNVLTLRKMHV